MAMRLFTKDEFEEHLSNHLSLIKTDIRTETTEIWQTQSGYNISVPVLPEGVAYPDYLLDEIYSQLQIIKSDLNR